MRVILVEDNEAMRELIHDHLKDNGFAVDAVGQGAEAISLVSVCQFDAVVLDLGLPDMDGMKVLASLRSMDPGLPALVLTARDRIEDRIRGLNAGADDYIIKPFDFGELEARLRAVLRRPGYRQSTIYAYGNVTFDTASREAFVNGSLLDIGRRETTLLEELIRAPGRIIPKDVLQDRLYALEDLSSGNALEAAVSRLRRSLTSASSSIQIETKRSIGYRFMTLEKN